MQVDACQPKKSVRLISSLMIISHVIKKCIPCTKPGGLFVESIGPSTCIAKYMCSKLSFGDGLNH
jgi:hypothetical protein